MNGELLRLIDSLHREKDIGKEILFEAIEGAITSAIKKHHNPTGEITTQYILRYVPNNPSPEPEERRVVGTIGELPDLAEAEKIGTPGIIVIGETVRTHRDFSGSIFQVHNLHQDLVAS